MALSTREREFCDLVAAREHDLLEDLRLHVNTPTGPGSGDGIEITRTRLSDRLVELGAWRTDIPGDPRPDWLYGQNPDDPLPVPDTTVCDRTQNRPGPRILIAGHLDTVHPASSSFRELTIAADGRTATGPGCVDMKGGLVIAVCALECLEQAGIDASWTFLMNADEETGSYCSDRTLKDQARRHDIGLALEPALADGSLAIERKGSGQFQIETIGRAAHVGREFDEGVSAVTPLARAILAVADMPDPARGRILNIGPLEGGSATNAVPDRARAWGNVRYPNAEIADEIAEMLDSLQSEPDAMPRTIVRRSFNRPAKPLTPEVERLALLARACAEDLGQSLPFAGTGGVCDGNILQAVGLTTIDTLGVRGGGLHTPDEWIDLSSLVERAQLLGLLISRLAAG